MEEVICYFLVENGVVIQKSYPFVEGWIEGPDWVAAGCFYSDGVFTAPPTPDEYYEQINTAQLSQLLTLANSQVTSIQGRIDTINDAIDFGEDLPGWAEEVPVRQAQLVLWKKYRIALNKIPLQAGWAVSATWPVQPEIYVDTSARTSGE